MTEEPYDPDKAMAEAEAYAKAMRKTYDDKQKKLYRVYEKARTPKARFMALAAMVRHHGEFMNSNILSGGWMADTVIHIARHIEGIAEDL